MSGEPKLNLIDRLMDPGAFPHRVEQLELKETHISWVILTGPFAYKIKKPVKFAFVDYSNSGSRAAFCRQELRLNRRFAPDLYLCVVAIYERDGKLRVGSEQEIDAADCSSMQPIEYAVKMRQFPQNAIVAAHLRDHSLTGHLIDQFANKLLTFHQSIELAAPTLPCVQTDRIRADAMDNLSLLSEEIDDSSRRVVLDRLAVWTANQFDELQAAFRRRLQAGFVRRCHGDMHLKNVIYFEGRLIPFDGIEFNEEFQWIDVLSELAFPVMDFVARQRPDLGWRLLNAYLEGGGDYPGLEVLRFYLVYRAMVRAKVTWLNPHNRQAECTVSERHANRAVDRFAGPWDKYLATAEYFAFGLRPTLAIMHGFSGSGKSTVALQRLQRHGGIRIRSDVERNRLAASLDSDVKYARQTSDHVYRRMLEQARVAIRAGFPTIVDATFLRRSCRHWFQQLARELNVDFFIVQCEAPLEVLHNRLKSRGPDPSEATGSVLDWQIRSHDPLTQEELTHVVSQPLTDC